MEATKGELTEELWFFNIEHLTSQYDDDVENSKQKMAKSRDLSWTNRESELPNQKYNIYYHYTYKDGKPFQVPQLIPETEDEKRRNAQAAARREKRLKDRV